MTKLNFKSYMEDIFPGLYDDLINKSGFLDIPTTTKVGNIILIRLKQNPILIMLDDGTKLYLTYDEFKRNKCKLEVGQRIKVIFQRKMRDSSDTISQILSISCD